MLTWLVCLAALTALAPGAPSPSGSEGAQRFGLSWSARPPTATGYSRSAIPESALPSHPLPVSRRSETVQPNEQLKRLCGDLKRPQPRRVIINLRGRDDLVRVTSGSAAHASREDPMRYSRDTCKLSTIRPSRIAILRRYRLVHFFCVGALNGLFYVSSSRPPNCSLSLTRS
jgi:hypothetical protein